ncbi:MAG TPA: ferritin-like domain-containing protein [Polyangia bacterium]|nr:ferritin-like domain-containing protein [Polyangia bacterium]
MSAKIENDKTGEKTGELFELELLGGGIERRYRKARPEVDQMPWGTMDISRFDSQDVVAARQAWTSAAFQEHRTAAACASTLRALIEARAPLDLVAMASQFPLDEVVHVELCARMAMELGGGTELIQDPDDLCLDRDVSLPPLLRAADLVTRFFCVGEALSIPLLRATRDAASHPLPRALLARIVKDEAAHGAFGWLFLDWAAPLLGASEREHLRGAAETAISQVRRLWDDLGRRPKAPLEIHALGWMQTDDYLRLAASSLADHVVAPLRARGIMVDAGASASS